MTEVELKLALPGHTRAGLVRQLARLPWLAGCALRHQDLHNTYYDTPDHKLLAQGAVLRVRRVGNGARACWLQTFKTDDGSASALSRRGEWESTLPAAEPSATVLAGTPWDALDPDGAVFAQLQPCFHTDFKRTLWMLTWADGSTVELALDLGQIVAGPQCSPIRELELELKTGQIDSLFEVAHAIALALPVIPSGTSKSERGYALAGASVPRSAPRGTAPTVDSLARFALQDAMRQFTGCLVALRHNDDPELVHQARVAWRRFRSARRLFRTILAPCFPDLELALKPLLGHLGAVRDLDVARAETLPRMANAYIAGDSQRARQWQQMMNQLARAGTNSRAALHGSIDNPATGSALIDISRWLDTLTHADANAIGAGHPPGDARVWALRHLRRQRQQLRRVQKKGGDRELQQHQLRIQAKRLRYGVDMLRSVLPPRRALRWHQLAARLQSEIGNQRDAVLAATLVHGLRGQEPIAEFLRGHVVAMAGMEEPGRPT